MSKWLKQIAAPSLVAVSLVIAIAPPIAAQSSTSSVAGPTTRVPPAPAPLLPDPVAEALRGGPEAWTSPQRLSSTLQVMLLLTVLSLAPAILLMTTSFVRIVVVFGLLRQALGTQQLPPSQVMTTLALFMTLLVMGPTWTEIYNASIRPYSQGEITDPEAAWNAGVIPLKRFMSRQIELAGNSDDVWLFYEYLPEHQRPVKPPETYDEVPLQVLLLPPVMISLPLKLLLFVLVDGWTLVVGMLLESFGGPP
jgi:flagellar biosynthetic protein FliP